MEKCEKEKKNNRERWFVFFLLFLLLILGIAIIILLLQRGNCNRNTTAPTDNPGDGVGLVIDPDAKDSPSSEHTNNERDGVAISGWSSMSIPANQKEISVDFYNPEENDQLYYLTFELRLYNDSAQDYEILYTSGLVEPGEHINQITLSRTLEEGIYEAVVHVQPYRMNEEKTLTNNADMKVKLIVK